MKIKKTKQGKFRFDLDYEQRRKLSEILTRFLESEGVDLLYIPLVKREDFSRHILYVAAHQFFIRFTAKFFAPNKVETFLLTRLEALVMVRIMGNIFNQDVEMLEFRNELLKVLK